MVTGFVNADFLTGKYRDVVYEKIGELIKSFLSGVLAPNGVVYKPKDGMLQICLRVAPVAKGGVCSRPGKGIMVMGVLYYYNAESLKECKINFALPKCYRAGDDYYEPLPLARADVILRFYGSWNITSRERVVIDFDTDEEVEVE